MYQALISIFLNQIIAVEKLESIYRSSDYVSNLCVIARSSMSFPIAVLSIHQVNLRHVISNSYDAAISRLDGAATSTLGTCPYIRHLLLSSCIDVGIRNGLRGSELLHAVVVAREEWTLENGLLMAGMKVNRANVAKFYEKQIKVGVQYVLPCCQEVSSRQYSVSRLRTLFECGFIRQIILLHMEEIQVYNSFAFYGVFLGGTNCKF